MMIDIKESLSRLDQVSVLKNGPQLLKSIPEMEVDVIERLVSNEIDHWQLTSILKNEDGTEWNIFRNNQVLLDLKSEFQEFVYSVSHDLKAPLRNISKFSEVLLRKTDQLDERTLKSLEFIQSGVQLMKGQLDGILEYSRVETQGETFVNNELTELFQQFEANNSAKLELKGAKILFEGEAIVFADRRQLYQLISKLLDNSLVFNNSAPIIKVACFEEGNFSGFTLKDNGIGIPEERIDNLFKIFGKFHQEIIHDGLGLGLTISKRIMERHNGFITIKNLKEGLQVTVGFPLAKNL